MKKIKYLILLMIPILFSCSTSELTYYTNYQGQTDPDFVFRNATSIALTPIFWTKEGKRNKVDELSEKILLHYIKDELAAWGAKPYIMPMENMAEDENGVVSFINLNAYPDLMLTCNFSEKKGSVYIPEETSVSVDHYERSFKSTAGHSVYAYTLFIKCTLWSEKPKYDKAVWRGSIVKGSPVPNLSANAQKMIHDLFRKKFLKINYY